MADYRFNYRFHGDPLPSEFGATFGSDAEAIRWWEGFADSRGEPVDSVHLERRSDPGWTTITQPT